MRFIFILLILLHALVHLLGFAKAFDLAPVTQLTQNISKGNGILWFVSAFLLVICGLLIYLKKDFWWVIASCALLVSQYVIFTGWHDAKFGTVVNIIILLATVIGFGEWNFRRQYHNEVIDSFGDSAITTDEILDERDIQHLPNAVKKYLRYTGSVGKPKVKNFKVEFSGEFRQNENAPWMPFTSEQFNFVEKSTRMFFMNAEMKHLPVVGFHCFKNAKAFMDIRLLSLFRVQYHAGAEMDAAETVTFFNDMCVMAPATLIDKRIKWLGNEGNKVNASFTNDRITISADLYFNDRGELINFESEDRFAIRKDNSLHKTRWSTPLSNYKEFDGYRIASYGETIYHFPEGDFCYGKFTLEGIEYNREAQ